MPYYTRDLKRDHNFDNHPCVDVKGLGIALGLLGFQALGFMQGLGFRA